MYKLKHVRKNYVIKFNRLNDILPFG